MGVYFNPSNESFTNDKTEIKAMPLSQMFDKVFDKISFDERCMKAGKTEQKIDFLARQKDR